MRVAELDGTLLDYWVAKATQSARHCCAREVWDGLMIWGKTDAQREAG
jgi:hypothetical protein